MVSSTPRPHFTPRERPGTHFTGGWVGPRGGLDRCGKSRPHRDSIPDRPTRSSVAIPTELPDPHINVSILPEVSRMSMSAHSNRISFKRAAFFWVITQRAMTISYRRFGTSCRSHFKGQESKKKEGGPSKQPANQPKLSCVVGEIVGWLA